MIWLPFLADKTVAVMGLGKSGTATARALAASGARVLAWDDNAAARAAAAAEGVTIAELSDMAGIDLVLWSPGIAHTYPSSHPVADKARAAGHRLICDIELLGRACPSARYLAISGTNGKSTTTSLLGHILQKNRVPTGIGGNLGIPALDLTPLGAEGTYVLELSSYQLELLEKTQFDISILLNITPDHLARHGGMEGYCAAKHRLFEHLKTGGTAVIGVDDEPCRAMAATSLHGGRIIRISGERAVSGGVYVRDGMLIDDTGEQVRPVMDLRDLASLPGRHNGQNVAAAFAAARAAGLPEEGICEAIRTYPGLAHRQQRVAVVDGVTFVNDSKATNADAVEKALLCYDAIYWILGGQAKEGGIETLVRHFPRIRQAFLIGEAAPVFAQTLEGKLPYTQCGTLDVAVRQAAAAAAADAVPGAVVLLSPACASWDQFKSFEHRGDTFSRLVEAMAGER